MEGWKITRVKVYSRPAPISRFGKQMEIMRTIHHPGSDISRVETRSIAEHKSFSVECLEPLLEAAGNIQRDLVIFLLDEPSKAGNIAGRLFSVKLYIESVTVPAVNWGEYFNNFWLVGKLTLELIVNEFFSSCYHSFIIVFEVVIHPELPLDISGENWLKS